MMTPEQFSGWVLLVLMSVLACISVSFISSARYHGRGIYYLTVNAIFRGNKSYQNWIRNNMVYYWCSLLVICLCPVILSLVPTFRTGNMIFRPELFIWINPVLWTAILFLCRWFFNRMK